MVSFEELTASKELLKTYNNFKLLSINEARKALGIRYETMRKLIEDGKIEYIEILGKVKIPAISLQQFIENNLVRKSPTSHKNINDDIDKLFDKVKRKI